MYWNIPVSACGKTLIDSFKELLKKYDISTNKDLQFRGEAISLLYDPGLFPHLKKYVSIKDFQYVYAETAFCTEY